MAVLVCYRVECGPHVNEIFQAVLIAHESAATRGKKNDNKLWKRVVLSETEFAWLPPNIAWSFAVMPYAGEGTVNIWPSIRRTWDCMDVLSRQTFSLWIWSSLLTRKVLKSSLCSQTWPLKGCA